MSVIISFDPMLAAIFLKVQHIWEVQQIKAAKMVQEAQKVQKAWVGPNICEVEEFRAYGMGNEDYLTQIAFGKISGNQYCFSF